MVTFMFRFVLSAMALAALVSTAEAASGGTVGAAPSRSGMALTGPTPSLWLQIRDVQSARNGGGNGCWNACFTDFDECMGVRTKNLCVSRVKTCLETCDRLSHRPGM